MELFAFTMLLPTAALCGIYKNLLIVDIMSSASTIAKKQIAQYILMDSNANPVASYLPVLLTLKTCV